MWLVATVLNSIIREHFHPHRKFCWMVLDSSFINFIALFKIPAFGRRALLSWWRAATAAAGWASQQVADVTRGHRGRGLPHKLQICVAAPAGASVAGARAARCPGQGAVWPGTQRAGVHLCLLFRYEYSPEKGWHIFGLQTEILEYI